MSKLLIIDIQNSYMEWAMQDDLLNRVEELSKNYSLICYLWDNSSGQDLYDELPEDWINPLEFDEEDLEKEQDRFYDRFNLIIAKQYGYIRNLMDSDYKKEDIIKFGKFMLKNNISDAREIYEKGDDIYFRFEKEFKDNSLFNEDFYSKIVHIPNDLIEELKSFSGCSIVGGARSECLEEISLIMKMAEIDHTILEDYCY